MPSPLFFYIDQPKKNHSHTVSRLKAVDEEEDQGKKSKRRYFVV